MAQLLNSNNVVNIITDQPKFHEAKITQDNQKWETVIESIIDNLNNGGDKKSAAVLNVNNNNKNGMAKTNIYKRTFYESIYLGDLKPALHTETAKAFQTNDWQDISLNGNKIFENMDAENIGDLEDLIKKFHVCQYVIRLTMALGESEKCNDFYEFMRMLEFVAKYIEEEKNGIGHTHATVKHHVSFNNSANIIIPSSARASMTTQSINLKLDEEEASEEVNHTNFLCFHSCNIFTSCCKKFSTSPSTLSTKISDSLMDSGIYLRQENETQKNISLDDEDENNKEELQIQNSNHDDDNFDENQKTAENLDPNVGTNKQLLDIEMRPQAMYKVKIPRNTELSKRNRVR